MFSNSYSSVSGRQTYKLSESQTRLTMSSLLPPRVSQATESSPGGSVDGREPYRLEPAQEDSGELPPTTRSETAAVDICWAGGLSH